MMVLAFSNTYCVTVLYDKAKHLTEIQAETTLTTSSSQRTFLKKSVALSLCLCPKIGQVGVHTNIYLTLVHPCFAALLPPPECA